MHRDDVPVNEPCFVADSALERRDHGHYCSACRKHVYDLSAMSEEAALALLELNGEPGLCVSYLATEAGQILHAASPTSQRHSRAATLLGVSAVAMGCTSIPIATHVGGVPQPDRQGAVETSNARDERAWPVSAETTSNGSGSTGATGSAEGGRDLGAVRTNITPTSPETGKVYLVRGGYDRIPRKKPADPPKKKKAVDDDQGFG